MENSGYTRDQLIYVADHEASGYSQVLTIPGWSIAGFPIDSLVRTHHTNFGDPRLPSQSEHSVLCYSLNIARSWTFFVWKLLLPLLVVLASSCAALLLAPQHIDSRIALPVTDLLTAVFLQETYADSLPDLSYLVLIDKIYGISYILIFVSILEGIITAYWVDKNDGIWIRRVMWADDFAGLANYGDGHRINLVSDPILGQIWQQDDPVRKLTRGDHAEHANRGKYNTLCLGLRHHFDGLFRHHL
ncbi:MAG: hypothetical protein VKI82_09420 [Leptolyngbya sp.]|nr:hypothetical protein [Leptolyngbya sp.]